MTETEAALYGKEIIITTTKIQNRKHRKYFDLGLDKAIKIIKEYCEVKE